MCSGVNIFTWYWIFYERLKNEKILYGDNKRQDGWIEGGNPKDGRGNAHERFGRYFTPSLLMSLREKGKLGDDVLPFWIVFEGNITRDPKRVRDITHMFGKHNSHFFLWQNTTNSDKLIAHFNNKLKSFLF